jgi:hypothetical protein
MSSTSAWQGPHLACGPLAARLEGRQHHIYAPARLRRRAHLHVGQGSGARGWSSSINRKQTAVCRACPAAPPPQTVRTHACVAVLMIDRAAWTVNHRDNVCMPTSAWAGPSPGLLPSRGPPRPPPLRRRGAASSHRPACAEATAPPPRHPPSQPNTRKGFHDRGWARGGAWGESVWGVCGRRRGC